MDVYMLQPTDVAGGTFALITVGTFGTCILLLLATFWVADRWKLPLALTGLANLIAAANYFQMKNVWLVTEQTPIIYRYVDWMVTIPIQVIVLYLFMAAISTVTIGLFWRLLVVSVVMEIAWFMGAVGFINTTLGFLIGIAGWLYILGEIFFGRLSENNAKSHNEPVQIAFFWLRLIVIIGWGLYPLCYFVNSFAGGVDVYSLNVVYNLADFLNKIAFGLIVLTAAFRDTASRDTAST